MKRSLALVFVCSIALSTAPPAVVGLAAQEDTAPTSSISIADVSVSPDDVAPGERVTITPTIRNLENSESNVEISSVYVRQQKRGGTFELSRARQLGGLNPGTEIQVPLTATFDDAGTKRLRVIVNAVNDREERIRVNYPVVVTVDEQHPQLDLEVNGTVASVEDRGTLTIANGLDAPARNVDVQVSGGGPLTISNARTVLPSLESGETATESFRYEADRPGTYRVTARLRYNVPDGKTRTTTTSVPVEIERLKRNVVLEATGDGTDVRVDVFNRGNVPVRNLTVSGESSNATVPLSFVGAIPEQSSRTVVVNASLDEPRADVTVRASYEVGSRTGRATDSVSLSETPGAIDLTGVNVQPEGGRLQITGSASNVGLTEVTSVTVSVVDTERVTPAAPSREYFVGRVPASDFVSFDVFARTTGNVSTVPLAVTYLVDGERERTVVQVPVDDAASADDQVPRRGGAGSAGGAGGLLIPALGALVVLGIVAAIVYGWRNRGGT